MPLNWKLPFGLMRDFRNNYEHPLASLEKLGPDEGKPALLNDSATDPMEPTKRSAVRNSYGFEETGGAHTRRRGRSFICELVVEALSEEGYNVSHVADGEQALVWCGRQVADVLITDIKLPGKVDGWQVAERCREHDPALPVIYATGFSPVAPRPVSGSLLLKKPYQPEEIVRAVRQVTESRRA